MIKMFNLFRFCFLQLQLNNDINTKLDPSSFSWVMSRLLTNIYIYTYMNRGRHEQTCLQIIVKPLSILHCPLHIDPLTVHTSSNQYTV
jgi:hypothetical protein